jgi:hypothetical protein
MSKLLWIGGTVAAALIARHFYELNQLNSKLQTNAVIGIQSIGLTDVTLKIDVTIKNPSSGTISIKYPYVTLFYGNTVLGTSEVKNTDFPIPAYSQQNLPTIILPVSTLSAKAMLPDLLAGKALTLKVVTYTTINGLIPYDKTDYISLTNGNGSK